MVFSSFEFLFRFLPAFLIIYFITPKKFRNAVLFLGSIAFYTYGEAQYVLLLLASVTVNYVIARSMYKTPEDGRGRRQAVLLVLALCYDFGMLFFFKYSGLTTKLPLGISFYTFQIAAYVIDVYRGIVPAEKSYVNLGTYLTMFPQLIAGPIVNYTEVSSCLKRRTVTARDFESGVRILVIGLGSKVIIADRVGMLWNNVQTIGFNSISTPLAWLGAVAYSMELYFDFAGYSMMAIGHCAGRRRGAGPAPAGKLPLPVPRAEHDGVLAPLAHYTGTVVPRLCIHSARRKPERQTADDVQPFCCVDTDRTVARGRV